MSGTEKGQVSGTAADIYEALFVPALFAQWPPVVLDAAEVGQRDSVLDVGCGSGVLARSARQRVDDQGSVVGIDPNEGMLAVARRSDPRVRWENGYAEQLPFPDGTFDRVVSQFAVMFFNDAAQAVHEMIRVTAPGGRVVIAAWAGLEHNEVYARLADLVDELFGPAAGAAIRAPFALGDVAALRTLAGGRPGADVTQHAGVARFPSLERWLHTEIRGWTLADKVDDDGLSCSWTARATSSHRSSRLRPSSFLSALSFSPAAHRRRPGRRLENLEQSAAQSS